MTAEKIDERDLTEIQKHLEELIRHGNGDLNIRVSNSRIVYQEAVFKYKMPTAIIKS